MTETLEQARSQGPDFLGDVYWDGESGAIFGKASGEADQEYGHVYFDASSQLFVFDSAKDGSGTLCPISFQIGGEEKARLSEDGKFFVGTTTLVNGPETDVAVFSKDVNHPASLSMVNPNAGDDAYSLIECVNDVGHSMRMDMFGTGWNPHSGMLADGGAVWCYGGSASFGTHEDFPIRFVANQRQIGQAQEDLANGRVHWQVFGRPGLATHLTIRNYSGNFAGYGSWARFIVSADEVGAYLTMMESAAYDTYLGKSDFFTLAVDTGFGIRCNVNGTNDSGWTIDAAGDMLIYSPKFGTLSAIGAETVTGYITIKDDTGAARKLAVVS